MKQIRLTGIIFIMVFCFFTGIGLADTEWTSTGNDVTKTTTDGNVGIGTTTPSQKLEVVGNINVTSANLGIMLDGQDSPIITRGFNPFTSGDYTGIGRWGMFMEPFTLTFGVPDITGAGNFNFAKYNDDSTIETSLMYIRNDGKVGIGTTTPENTLDVRGWIQGSDEFSRVQAGTFAGIPIILLDVDYNNTEDLYHEWTMAVIPDDDFPFTGMKKHSLVFAETETLNGETAARLVINSGGNVGIGTIDPGDYKLAVKGKIRAEEIVVETGWSDFVLADNYNLRPLDLVESFIKENKRLPEIPSAQEVQKDGLPMADMMTKQMQKIEELTLYLIEMKKENEALKDRVAVLEAAK